MVRTRSVSSDAPHFAAHPPHDVHSVRRKSANGSTVSATWAAYGRRSEGFVPAGGEEILAGRKPSDLSRLGAGAYWFWNARNRAFRFDDVLGGFADAGAHEVEASPTGQCIDALFDAIDELGAVTRAE